MKKQRNIQKKIAVVIGIVLLLAGCTWYAFSLLMPARAAERDAISTGGGSTVSIRGFDISYKLYNAESKNTPIIVISGGVGLSSDYLEESLSFLAEEHPLLFYDARGCGRSQMKADLANYSIQSFTDEVQDLKEHFFPEQKIILAAHSFGGIVAMNYAADHSDNLERLILMSSTDASYSPLMTNAYFKIGLPPHNQLEANKWYMRHINEFFGPYFDNEAAKDIFDNTTASYAVMTKVGSKKLDLSKRLINVDIPVLVLVGGEKEYPITGIDTARHLERIFPNATLEQVVNSGHFMFAEENDIFRQLVKDFLD